jgi:hypothetical protein
MRPAADTAKIGVSLTRSGARADPLLPRWSRSRISRGASRGDEGLSESEIISERKTYRPELVVFVVRHPDFAAGREIAAFVCDYIVLKGLRTIAGR